MKISLMMTGTYHQFLKRMVKKVILIEGACGDTFRSDHQQQQIFLHVMSCYNLLRFICFWWVSYCYWIFTTKSLPLKKRLCGCLLNDISWTCQILFTRRKSFVRVNHELVPFITFTAHPKRRFSSNDFFVISCKYIFKLLVSGPIF